MQQQANQSILELNLLYYVHQEVLENEDVSKILWNENLKFFDNLKTQQINLIGLYGTLDTVKNYLSQKCGCTIKISDDIHNHKNRGILCFTQHLSIYFIGFVAPDEFYIKDKFEETIEVSLFRYLKDLCKTIILLPSEGIINNWKALNTHYYQNSTNAVQDFKIQERLDLDIVIKQVQLKIDPQQAKYLQALKFSQENLRFQSRLYKNDEQRIVNIFRNFLIEESLIESMEYEEQPDVVKVLIIEQHKIIAAQILDIKKKLQEIIMNNKFDHIIHKEIHELTFNFCWKRQNIIIQNLNDEEILSQFNSLISKSQQQIDQVKTPDFLNQYMQIFKNCFLQQFDKIIKQIEQNFIKEISDQLTILYSNIPLILLVDQFQFMAITKQESTIHEIIETRIEKIQQNEIFLYGFQSFENSQVHYYFQTHLYQQMYIIKLEKNNKYKYVWIQQLPNQKIEIIFTFNQQSNLLVFYYDQTQQSLYVFNTQMGTTVIVYDEEKKRITSDKSKKYQQGCETYVQLCYLQYYSCFFLLGQDEKIYKLICQESNSFEQLAFDSQYNKLLSTGIGYYYCLANYSFIDIFNFNNQQIYHIDYQVYGYHQVDSLLLFHNQDDWFLILSNQQKSLTLQISNINTSQQIIPIQKEKKQAQYSNPYLDLIKGSNIKFGPTFQFLPTQCYQKNELIIQQKYYEQFASYYQLLYISETDELVQRDIHQQDGYQMQFIDFYKILISRVPVQLCTVDKSILIPLNKGQIKQKIISQQRKIQILQKVYELDFSVIEFTKNFPQMKIYIVSIMGKQSSGKSYLLNRIFGTRFGVSSARCTDGIWMSFSIIDNVLFILLDCEGLFGSKRTDEEETMLLTFITSISDATILNQDLTFDRHLNKQLNKLTNITQNLSGQNLFQGQLIIVVRDVNQQEQGGARRELLVNIQQIKNSQKTSNFISKLFSDRFQLLFMSHFQAQPFENDIIIFRQKLLQNAKESNSHWKDINQLTKVMKIMLVQLELQDYRALEEVQQEDNLNNLRQRALDLWYTQQENDRINNLNFLNKDETYKILFDSYFKDSVKSIQHNYLLEQVEQHINNYMNQRALSIKQGIGQFLVQIKDKQYQEQKSNEIYSLLQNLVDKYQICKQKCEQCFLQCSLRKNHEKKIIQKRFQLEEQISQDQLQLNELTIQFNSIDKIQFDQEQLIEEQEKIKNQIKYKDQMENLQKILQKIKTITQIEDSDKSIQFDEGNLDVESQNLTQNMNSMIKEYVKGQQLSLALTLTNYEVDSIIENQNLEVIYREIDNLNRNYLQNDKKLQEQLQEMDDYMYECKNQENLESEIKNLEEEEQKLNTQIFQNQFKMDELQKEKQQNLEPQQYNNLEQLQDTYEQLETQRSYLQNLIININDELNTQQQLIIQNIQDNSIECYLQELIDFLNHTIQKVTSDIDFVQKKIQQKNSQLQNLNLQGTQNAQQRQQNLQDEISILLSQIEVSNQQLQLLNQQKEYLRVLQNNDNYDDEFYQLAVRINFSEKVDQKVLYQQRLDTIFVDIQKIEQQQKLFINQQILTSQIIKIQKMLDQNIENRGQLMVEKQQKILIREQFSQNPENLLIIETKIGQLEQISLDLQIEIKKLQEFKLNLIEIFSLKYSFQYGIKYLDDNLEYMSNINKADLIDYLNKNQSQLQLLNEVKQIGNTITDCNNQISYGQYQLNELNKQPNSYHNCGRQTHICDQICQACQVGNLKCHLKSGHNQLHLCDNSNHQCFNICRYCDLQCKNLFGHPLNEDHDCKNQHPCAQKCSFCNEFCNLDVSIQHQIHQCKQTNCNHKCYFNLHYYNQNQKCLNQCSSVHTFQHNLHICNNVHQCINECEEPGICQIDYKEEITEWQLENGSFYYSNYIQNVQKQQCARFIKQNQIKHQGESHQCKNIHKCDHKCPECHAYCSKKYGHASKHQIQKHRNKEQQCFTQLYGRDREKIIIKVGLQTRQYNVGDSSTPETCQISCERRGRAHYHLIPCQGEDKCLEIRFPQLRSRHQNILYIGQNEPQDEILCEDFWQYHNWEHPITNVNVRDNIDLCNYYCCLCQENQFCTSPAWHTNSRNYQDHQFLCQETHVFYGIDICFVVDTTQSMERHMGIIIGAINQFQNAQEIYQQEDAIRYSIVTYWDHDYPYDENQIVVKSQDFTNYEEILQFLKRIQFIYSNDHCEAMFDGLNAAIYQNWRNKAKKFIILIADSPPHGRLYNSYWKDNFKAGCPCGFNENNVFPHLNQRDINLVILQFNQELNQSITEFRRYLPAVRVIREVAQQDFIQQLDKLICDEQRIQEITSQRIPKQVSISYSSQFWALKQSLIKLKIN